MKQDFRHALTLGLERQLFALPPTGPVALFNAVPLSDLDEETKSRLVCEQGFRPDFLALEKQGYSAEPVLTDQPASAAIVLAGRNRRVNELNITRAWNACPAGSSVIVAGDKTSGIGALRKWVGDRTGIVESFSKFHALVFSIDKHGEDWPEPDITKEVDGYHLAEGVFSADGPDKGSRLLAEQFDKRVSGRIADFGAGWGYLSSRLLESGGDIKTLDLYEASWQALELARQNLMGKTTSANFHWCDVTSEYKKQVLDWVIMNPPFHSGRAAEPMLGQAFIKTAASTLPSGGRLLMVANKNLPYEKTLERAFRKFEILETRDGFKVIEARK